MFLNSEYSWISEKQDSANSIHFIIPPSGSGAASNVLIFIVKTINNFQSVQGRYGL